MCCAQLLADSENHLTQREKEVSSTNSKAVEGGANMTKHVIKLRYFRKVRGKDEYVVNYDGIVGRFRKERERATAIGDFATAISLDRQLEGFLRSLEEKAK